MSLSRTFVRLYSKTSKSTIPNLSKTRIQKALNLLQDSKFNFETITEAEKQNYINEFSQILSSGLNSKAETKNITQHFDQSLIGLNNLLANTLHVSKPSQYNFEQLSMSVKNCKNTVELLNIFDDLVHNNTLDARNLRLIISNKYSTDLQHIINKITFINHDGEHDALLLLVCVKASILKSSGTAKRLYDQHFSRWTAMRNQGLLSPVLERTFYQAIKFHQLDPAYFTETLRFSLSSYILLIEALPRNIKYWVSTDRFKNLKLSKNQSLFIKTLLFLRNQKDIPLANRNIKILLKLSVSNKIHEEDQLSDDTLTIHKHKYHSELNKLLKTLILTYGEHPDLVKITHILNDTGEQKVHQPVLRFI